MTPHVVNVLLSGVFHASILFLVAAGLQVVFGVQKIFNLACGSFYALGAYAGVSAVGWYAGAGGPPALFLLPVAAAGLAVGAVGIVVERGLLSFVYDRDETFQLLLTFAVVLMMEDAIRMIGGTSPRSTSGLYLTYGQVRILGAVVPVYNLSSSRRASPSRCRSAGSSRGPRSDASCAPPPTIARWPRRSASTCAASTPRSSRWAPPSARSAARSSSPRRPR